jgi:HD superfamily phosphohydrolase
MSTESMPEAETPKPVAPIPVARPEPARPREQLALPQPVAGPKPIGEGGKVIRDAVHGLIRIEPGDDVLLHLINTPEFQRLRRVRQLGVSSMTYPGAEHSRFTHSLGVMNFAQRILGSLLHRYREDSAATDILHAYERTVKAAALLHDVGHGPFSHMIERASNRLADHEKTTLALIKSPDSQIRAVLEHYKIDPQAICDILQKSTEYRLLSDIVSSQLDADRMDYILRDALSTGVRYGSYDSEWLINSLCIGTEPQEAATTDAKLWRLCLEERRGLYSAEQLIIARRHMSLQVYFHRATRGWEANLLCLFNAAAQLAKENRLPDTTPPVIRDFFAADGKLPHKQFLLFDEAAMTYALQAWSTSEAPEHSHLASLASAFLNRRKSFACNEFKSLTLAKFARLQKELSAFGQESLHWLIDEITFSSYKDFGAIFKSLPKPAILILARAAARLPVVR